MSVPELLSFLRTKKDLQSETDPDIHVSMTTKDKVIQAVQNLPDDASFEDAMERLLFLVKIERGLQQADTGQTVPHAQVKVRMSKWLK